MYLLHRVDIEIRLCHYEPPQGIDLNSLTFKKRLFH